MQARILITPGDAASSLVVTNVFRVLIAGSTKVLSASFFFLAAHLPIQDVSEDAQIHISAAIIIFGSYYAHFGPVIYTYYY